MFNPSTKDQATAVLLTFFVWRLSFRISQQSTRADQMYNTIALFNHKGGVSKTTTTFNLGWMLAEKGYRVVTIDTDPQCNLTGLVLDYDSAQDFDEFYSQYPNANIKAALAPPFEAQPRMVQRVECVEVAARKGLFLVPGHVNLSEYEVTLGIAQELSGTSWLLRWQSTV